ncbi:hypothetical protein U1Q18_013837 [Sarracenia purpurea var. burkii]
MPSPYGTCKGPGACVFWESACVFSMCGSFSRAVYSRDELIAFLVSDSRDLFSASVVCWLGWVGWDWTPISPFFPSLFPPWDPPQSAGGKKAAASIAVLIL